MSLSIIYPVLNSHEIVRRQVAHMLRWRLRRDTEIIIVDDGSHPPLEVPDWIRCIRTHDTRPWTWPLARNRGALEAAGDYLLFLDIDHVLPQRSLGEAEQFNGDMLYFQRQLGVLTEDGSIDQSVEVLQSYGVPRRWIKPDRAICKAYNIMLLRKSLFWRLGGYVQDRVGRKIMLERGEDRIFRTTYRRAVEQGLCAPPRPGPVVYCIPNGRWCGDIDSNPQGLFHGLSRVREN